MSSLVVRGYESTNAGNLRWGYREPCIVTARIIDNKNGRFVRLNKVTLKYPDFIKDVDANVDVHVRVFDFRMKANAETFEKYIINAFSYTLRNTTLNLCHNYMLEFLDYTFSELT